MPVTDGPQRRHQKHGGENQNARPGGMAEGAHSPDHEGLQGTRLGTRLEDRHQGAGEVADHETENQQGGAGAKPADDGPEKQHHRPRSDQRTSHRAQHTEASAHRHAPERHEGHTQGRPRGDPEDAGPGEGILEVGLHQQARQSQGAARKHGHAKSWQAQIPKDGAGHTLSVQQGCPLFVRRQSGRTREEADREQQGAQHAENHGDGAFPHGLVGWK